MINKFNCCYQGESLRMLYFFSVDFFDCDIGIFGIYLFEVVFCQFQLIFFFDIKWIYMVNNFFCYIYILYIVLVRKVF